MLIPRNLPSARSLAALILCCAAVAGPVTARAQMTSGVIGDRPGQITPLSRKGEVQIASSVQMEGDHELDASRIRRPIYDYTSTLHLRVGIASATELRLGCQYGHTFEKMDRCYRLDQGISNVSLGTKSRIREMDSVFPEFSVFTNLRFPTGTGDGRIGTVLGGQFQADYTVGDGIGLTGNLGCEWEIFRRSVLLTYTATAAIPLFERSSIFFDLTGEHPVGYCESHILDAGFTYRISSRLQCDFAGGIGYFGDAPTYLFFTGISCIP
ncbi:MAG: transporter [Chlorobi bacterium]|nr:transporter [Chlorobiota bacterium]